jgi:hypothetical protein
MSAKVKSKQNYSFITDLTSLEVEDNVVKGVSIITVGEALGHGVMVTKDTLQDVVDNFPKSGVKVKADHEGGVADIVGTMKNPRIDGEQVRGDLKLLKKHSLYEQFLEMINEMASNFGLSIAFEGHVEDPSGEDDERGLPAMPTVRCDEVWSVDLVTDPAANPAGLFARILTAKDGDMELQKVEASMTEVAVDPTVIPAEPSPEEAIVEPVAAVAEAVVTEPAKPEVALDEAPVAVVPPVEAVVEPVKAEPTELEIKAAHIVSLEQKISGLEAELQKCKDALTAKSVELSKVEKKVQEQLAEVGITEIDLSRNAKPTKAEILAKYEALKKTDLRAACALYQQNIKLLQPERL